MNHATFASHMGFSTWDDLLRASECIAFEPGRAWYVTETNTWYKWVVWNTNYDMYYNHKTREDALKSMKWLFDELHIHISAWCAPEVYDRIQSIFMGQMSNSVR
ncbi:hypothetical protein [Alicyclobacillus dauci]|uniref:Uncharacterized protein n=1 Tax=Alicyclobacillus dauci TaxID=1475485 RepID=A0ABY6YZV7_9BACL|nr:hypothetical protein [Alicyclobacillus dauci]WAH36040.1 hypothetical protein NZD86_17530 [Alicyclobacillus dauci]